MFTLIKNANLYSPEHLGMNDVLLADDKIALIDRKIELTGIPFDTIDAGGCAVTPGFIDIHRHADAALFRPHFGELELKQGLTTIVNGNCGLSITPCSGPVSYTHLTLPTKRIV